MTTSRHPREAREVMPPADVAESEEGVHLLVELPGVQPDSISVTVEDDILTVSAQPRPRFTGLTLRYRESDGAPFRRNFRLSRDLSREGLTAEYKNGLLFVFLPKAEHTIPRRIEIKTS